MTDNVLQLTEVGDYEAQNLNIKQMLNRSKNVHTTTTPLLLAMCCYVPFFFTNLNQMEASTIKFKTIQFLNGTKYLSEKQVEDLCHLMCYNLKIEKTEDNFNNIKEACRIYFTLPLTIV